jgi:hypothetical protein
MIPDWGLRDIGRVAASFSLARILVEIGDFGIGKIADYKF